MSKKKLRNEDLVHLVTAPVLRQMNQNTAAVLEVLGEVRESLDAIARQIAREILPAQEQELVKDIQ
jgi:hypothetical protein